MRCPEREAQLNFPLPKMKLLAFSTFLSFHVQKTSICLPKPEIGDKHIWGPQIVFGLMEIIGITTAFSKRKGKNLWPTGNGGKYLDFLYILLYFFKISYAFDDYNIAKTYQQLETWVKRYMWFKEQLYHLQI